MFGPKAENNEIQEVEITECVNKIYIYIHHVYCHRIVTPFLDYFVTLIPQRDNIV